MIALTLKKARYVKRPEAATIGLLLAYFTAVLFFLQYYFIQDINLWLGLIILPHVLIIERGKYAYRYLWPFIASLALLFIIPAKTVFFLTELFGILSLIEIRLGKTNSIFFWLLLMISPAGKYFSSLLGMPVRLWLSEVTGWILNSAGKSATTAGNMIMFDGVEFSVDPACAGLGMMLISLIVALFALAHYQRKTGKRLSGFWVILFLTVVVVLNIFSNLFRIVILVLFKIMPGNFFHDLIGIVCLVVYVIAVLFWICSYLYSHYAKPVAPPIHNRPKTTTFWWHSILFICMVYGGYLMPAHHLQLANADHINFTGYKKEMLETGILKFENTKALVYVKPVNFYTPEHNPMICWTNSGYEFKYMNREVVNGKEICTGILQKGADSIYTAWWFDNGKHKTISQIDWRWRALKGEPDFNLINISAGSSQELIAETQKLMKLTSFRLQNVSDTQTNQTRFSLKRWGSIL